MEYTEVIFLLTKEYDKDEIGNITSKPIEEKSFAKLNSVGTREFYNAMSVGLKPQFEFQIRKTNYKGQTELRYNDVTYTVIRSIHKSQTDVVLVVSKKEGSTDV